MYRKKEPPVLLAVVLSVILMAGGAMGCDIKGTNPATSSARQPSGPGFEIGIGKWIRSPWTETQCAVRSEYSIFDINNVALDFYYGNASFYQPDYPSDGYLSDEFSCIGLYFWNKQSPPPLVGHQDYRNIENGYFAKEISLKEYYSGKYAYTVVETALPPLGALDPSIRIQLNHHETMSIPAGVFVGQSGTLIFCVVMVSEAGGGYVINGRGSIAVSYEYIDEQTVRLSNPEGLIPR